MSQSPVLESKDRLERLEQETTHLATKLKQASTQISMLQLALLLVLTALVGGGFYLITTGRLQNRRRFTGCGSESRDEGLRILQSVRDPGDV